MSDVNWWMDASCRWHQGLPPPGWWQAHDGRWHPPAPDDVTAEMTISPPVAGAHVARSGQRASLLETYRAWPRWARLAGPVAASFLVVGGLGAAAAADLGRNDPEVVATDDPTTTTAPGTAATPPNAAGAPPTATTVATTTAAVPSGTGTAQPDPTETTVAVDPAAGPPTTPGPTNNDVHQAAACSPEGATALSSDGTSLVCTTHKCHGAPFSEPRWRRADC